MRRFRKAIDTISILRARVIRVGLFGTLLHRESPVSATSPEDRAHYLSILRDQSQHISAICDTLGTGRPLRDISPAICCWLHRIARRDAEGLDDILRVGPASLAVLAAAESGNAEAQARALDIHMQIGRGGFFDRVTALCDTFWADLAGQQSRELAHATAAAAALGTRLNRLEHIGKHVRLVSLNASVEAARAGDAGKGLMVIAHEFKTLAEEIQNLAREARRDIEARALPPPD